MALDTALLLDALDGGGPWLRLYAFESPTVSLGRGERADTVLDRGRCDGAGVGQVRRPTGGRAVLHDDELTYCVALGPHAVAALGGAEGVTRTMGELLAAALVRLGVAAETIRTTPPPPSA